MHMSFTLKAFVTLFFKFLILDFYPFGLGNSKAVFSNPQVAQCRLENSITP